MTNQVFQQSKSDSKVNLSIASLVLGIISIVIGGVGYIFVYGTYHWLDSILIVSSFLIPLTGLVLGIIGLKSPKKIIALAGMGLSVIALMEAIFFNLLILFFRP